MKKIALPNIAVILVTLLAITGMVHYARTHNGSNEPVFSFDESKAEGWWSSGNSNQQMVAGNDYNGIEPRHKLPTADISVHHVTADHKAEKDGCFALFSYFNYRRDDIDGAYKEYESKKTELHDNAQLEKLGTSQQTLASHEGPVSFELRQYDLSVPGSDILSGYQVGFANTTNGSIKVEGVCKSAKDLALTLPVIDAVQLQK